MRKKNKKTNDKSNQKILEARKIIKEQKKKIKLEKKNIRKKQKANFKKTKLGKICFLFSDDRNSYSFSEMFWVTIISLVLGVFACFSVFTIISGGRNYFKMAKQLSKFYDVYDTIVSNYYGEIDKNDLIEAAIDGMVSSVGDVYTSYNDAKTTDSFNQMVNGTYEGIGCTITIKDENIVVVEPDTTEIFVEDSDYIDPEPLPINITPSISAGKPTYCDDGYSLEIRVKDAPGGKYYVSLLEHNGTKEVARSNDGEHFTGIPASTNDGLFDVAVFLAANDSMICSPLPVGGFESQEVVKDVMKKEQLQKLIEDVNSDLTGAQDWIVTDYKLHFTGLSADDTPPVKLSEVQTRLDLLWNKVTVAKLEYDKNHRITDVYIDVQK